MQSKDFIDVVTESGQYHTINRELVLDCTPSTVHGLINLELKWPGEPPSFSGITIEHDYNEFKRWLHQAD